MTDKLIPAQDLFARINSVARNIPTPGTVQEENELNPSPARLAFRMRLIEIRLSEIERAVGIEQWPIHPAKR